MLNLKSKAQTWSMDIILGIVVFVGAFMVFYLFLGQSSSPSAKSLEQEAAIVIKQVASSDSQFRVVDNNEVNESRLYELKNLSYDELKRRLRIEGDFCIYIEDEKGYVVLLNNSYRGIGSPGINISGVPCSQK